MKKSKSKKITPFDVVRAVSSTIVFGIPLIVSTATIVGYGLYKIFKKSDRN